MLRSAILSFIVFSSATVFVTSAFANSPTKEAAALAEKHSRQGVEHYQAGRYPEAVAEMLSAYQAVPDPDLLYNIARIYEKLSEFEIAISYYQRFVVSDGADPERVKKALEHVQRLKKEERSRQSEVARVEDPATKQQPKPKSENPVNEPPSAEAAPSTKTDEPVSPIKTELKSSHSVVKLLPWTMMGLGLVTTGVGAFYGMSALDASKAAANMNANYEDRVASQATGQSDAGLADILMISGGSLLVAGLVWELILPNSTSEDNSKTASITSPRIQPILAIPQIDQVYFGLGGHF